MFLYDSWEFLLYFLTYEDIVVLMCSAKWLSVFLCGKNIVWTHMITSITSEKYHLKDLVFKQ